MKSIEFDAKFPDISFQDKLRESLRLIKTWEGQSDWDVFCAADLFMDSIARLYLDYFQHHLEEAQSIGAEFAEDIKWAMPWINELYITKNHTRFRTSDAWDGLWHEVCWVASTIEVFHLMFAHFAGRLDDTFFWEYIDRYRDERFMIEEEEIPPKMPFSHSWWFREYDLEGKAEFLGKKISEESNDYLV